MNQIVIKHDRIDENQDAITFWKSLFGAIPVAGQLFNEIFFEKRSRVKQERYNSFTQLLIDFFLEHPDVNIHNANTEEFGDLFESVLLRVGKTKVGEKHKRFRDILVNQMINPETNIDNAETYLDLISSLSEIEIQILFEHRVFDREFEELENELTELRDKLRTKRELTSKEKESKDKGYANNYSSLQKEIQEIKDTISDNSNKIDQHINKRDEDYYNISYDDFLYYKQSLYSKGLLIDTGIGALSRKTFQKMSITEFGKKFIEFIVNSEAPNKQK